MINKILILSIFLLSAFYGNAQIHNVNPDKNGEPWIVGGLRVPSEEEINKVPLIKEISGKSRSKDLPAYLDNSTKQYFRPVFNQTNGSCAQASGIAYNFTYEINRERGTSANVPANQFPTHYTYNFLNGGSGQNGSWYVDGWNIVKADGCPTVAAYGGLAYGGDRRWYSGYDNYEADMNNRVKDYFAINVSTPEGLEILKHWMYDHLEGASDGSLVNFSAGINNTGYDMEGYKIVSWGHPVNHAMTFVGWDDNISYDFNNDGNITNDVDINNDGVVDMKDWERGALIMVNSWGTSWGNNGKAYVMYKLLAEPVENGGINANRVYGIHVKESQTPELIMKVKIAHSSRHLIKISAGVSQNTSDTEPEHELDFPLFSKQGGDFPMNGFNANPLEIALDISPLLSYVNSGENAKYFLKVVESDSSSAGSGQIYDFSIKDNAGNEYVCSSHNVAINNNSETLMSVVADADFDAPEITTESLPEGNAGGDYSYQLDASGGSAPYSWSVLQKYTEENLSETYPSVNTGQLTPSNDDDGYVGQTLDFDFPFYGELYNEVYVLTDGSILFEPGFSYLRTEDAIKANKMIAVFASDLMIYPANGDGIFYEGDANHATFRWKTALYGDENANIDVAVTLYPNGEIKFFYGNGITQDLSWASGVSNGKGSYLIPDISGSSDPSNTQLKMIPQAYPVGMFISSDGVFQGTCPNEENTWSLDFVVTDNNNISKIKTLNFTVGPAGSSIENLTSHFVNCYPNPTDGIINFSYSLEKPSSVDLSIYDITGRKLINAVNEFQSAGNRKIVKDLKLPEGIYFYKLHIGEKEYTGKIIVNPQ